MNLVNIVDVIMDDNVSGTMFLRFQPIIERIKRGEIEVIVFKDASRLRPESARKPQLCCAVGGVWRGDSV